MLAELPVTPAAVAFAESVLDDGSEHYLVQRKALGYFGQQRLPSGQRFFAVFVDKQETDLRTMALYMGARLGEPTAKERIERVLAATEIVPSSAVYGLLLAYAEVATPDEFVERVPEYLKKTFWEYNSALRVSRFRVAGSNERAVLARQMMGKSRSIYETKIAADHILANEGPQALVEYLGVEAPPSADSVARNRIRRAGFRIVRDSDRFRLEPRERP
jgi:hypothetical protein